jgi:NAD(P)-dependent dehydrogenase (short-subunit alcohol dehydrogenase family)
MRKILILGGTGGLGSQLTEVLSLTHDVTSIGSADLDITDKLKCEDFFKNNRFDILINLSGYNFDSFIHKLDHSKESNLNRMLDVNIKGSINVVSSALKHMRDQKYGRIILISSVLAQKDVVGTGIYSACKAFLDKFVKTISAENIGKGITANTIQLGYFDGGMTYRIPDEMISTIKESIGLKRFGSIEELAHTIEYFISTEYVTGINLKIDGGL